MFNDVAMKILERKIPYKIYYSARTRQYCVTIRCTLLALFLRRSFDVIRPYVEKYPIEFVRGFFDAEGSIGVTLTYDGLQPQLNVVNTNKEYIFHIARVLRKYFGVDLRMSSRTMRSKKTLYSLYTHRLNLIEAFAQKIGFGIRRKSVKLEDVIELLRKYGAKEAAEMWVKLYIKEGRVWKSRSADIVKISELKARA